MRLCHFIMFSLLILTIWLILGGNIDVNNMSEDAKCLADLKSHRRKGPPGSRAPKILIHPKIYNILEFNKIIPIPISIIQKIGGFRRKKNKHNYFKSIGTELAKFSHEIMGFRVRPIVKPIFFRANHNLFYVHFPWQFIRNLLKLQKIAYLRLM